MRKKKKQTSKPPEPVKETSGGDESVKNLEENESLLKGFEGNDENRAELQVSNENRGSGVNQLGICQINTDLVSIPTVSSLSKSVEGVSVHESQGSSKEGEASVNSSPVSHHPSSTYFDVNMERWRYEYRMEQQAALNAVLNQKKMEEKAGTGGMNIKVGRVLEPDHGSETVKNNILSSGLNMNVDKSGFNILNSGLGLNLDKSDEGLIFTIGKENSKDDIISKPSDEIKVNPMDRNEGTTLFSSPGNNSGFVPVDNCPNFGSDPGLNTGSHVAEMEGSKKDNIAQSLDLDPMAEKERNNQHVTTTKVGPDIMISNEGNVFQPSDGIANGGDQSGMSTQLNKNIGPHFESGPVINDPVITATGPVNSETGPKIGLNIKDNMKGLLNELTGSNGTGPVSGITVQHLQFGSFSPTKTKTPSFEFVCDNNLNFEGNGLDVDPIRGTKYWNQELFAKFTKGIEVLESETRLLYETPKKDEDGEFVVDLNGHFMTKSVKAHRLQLYGYFVGDSLPFQVVKENLIKMWHKFGVTSIIKKSGGFYFFKFANDEGLLQVLERNPWLVKNIPLVLQLWEPDSILSKPDPSSVPIWVTIKDLPLCLWNGGNIGQLASCVGRPLMLDKATYDRCEKKSGPLSFARVLVDASASCGLPDRTKVRFPPRNGLPGKKAFLEFGYKWKPPLCHLCGLFGHLTSVHEPKVQEPVVNIPKPQNEIVVDNSQNEPKKDADGFIEVQKKKRNKKPKAKVTWAPIEKMGIKNNGQQSFGSLNGQSNSTDGAGPSGVKMDHIKDGSGTDLIGPDKAQNNSAGSKGTGVFVPGFGPVSSPKQKENSAAPLGQAGKNVATSSMKSGPLNSPKLDSLDSLGFKDSNPLIGPIIGPEKDPKMKAKVDGSNRFYALVDEDEDECYDADLGIWEHEIALAHKYFNSNTRPPDDEYEKWSKELKAYFRSLKRNSPPKGSPKKNVVSVIQDDGKEDESDDVESETHESARFMSLT